MLNFNWQPGYGAFSFGHSDIDPIAKYVMNQKEYHKSNTFKEEYLELLKIFEVDYNEDYLFDWMEN